MNLYSNKQKWKIVLLIIALVLVGASLFVSNSIVNKVGNRERERVKQWADAIKKRVELVELTNKTFTQLRHKEKAEMEMWIDATMEISKPIPDSWSPDFSFPLKIISKNKDIPVILIDQKNRISSHINLKIDTAKIHAANPHLTEKELQELVTDSILSLANEWKAKKNRFTVEVYEDLFMTYIYNDSYELTNLERERDSLINSFNRELIENKELVPVVLMDSSSDTVIATNFTADFSNDSILSKTIEKLRFTNKPIEINFTSAQSSILYYDDSPELRQLQFFPYIQFGIIGLFIFIGYLIFSTFRKAEQNQVWAGMAKETAHQLGTPLSSLIGWIELLKTYNVDEMVPNEMEKDVKRLMTVTDRFSKIGSTAKLEMLDIVSTTKEVMDYLRSRISDKIVFVFACSEEQIDVLYNPSLMEWVLENICKNAVDSMETSGVLMVKIHLQSHWVHIDIKDTGKGIHPKQFNTIFEPGFTTKKRGWGLGLSLVKRIIKEYHKGKVFVLESEMGKGATFRISLPR